MGYSSQLKQFIKQSKTDNLKTKQFDSIYEDLKVQVSFGKAVLARIPWISFLAEGQKTTEGIYPAYLLFKNNKKLILAYGISETETPLIQWNLKDAISIRNFFLKEGLQKPDRYGDSLIFKVYDVEELPSDEVLNNDLAEIINRYKLVLSNKSNIISRSQLEQSKFDYKSFLSKAQESNLQFSESLIVRFISSLLTKPFVVLTGLSGSGKTKLAQSFVSWISGNDSQYCIVPVGADWTNREPLLGFPNALDTNEYIKPQNGVLDVIINANKNLDKPYFLILDEMNLSHVERYFADFLSAMESKSAIELHSKSDLEGVPSKIELPKNLFIIGTVNIDETTYMFSPKVLDRANVIEFRVTEEEMSSYLNNLGEINLNALTAQGNDMAAHFVALAKQEITPTSEQVEVKESMLAFFKELKKTGSEFGYRSAGEILRFISIAQKVKPDWDLKEIFDVAIMQKLLPKVHGSRKKLAPVLENLGILCLKGDAKITDVFDTKSETNYSKDSNYPVSLEKIVRMHNNLMDNGFTSYAEA